jgi:hypothetical protein
MTPKQTPARYQKAKLHVVDSAMSDDYVTSVGRWLFNNRKQFTRAGDELGTTQFSFELGDLDRLCPDLIGELRARILLELEEASKTCKMPAFEAKHVDTLATLYHNGGLHDWHEEGPEPAIAFAFYMHTDPKMFNGGELEFVDGTKVEPANGRLVLYDASLRHRVRPVECWSAHVLHGRWALVGWIHDETPKLVEGD